MTFLSYNSSGNAKDTKGTGFVVYDDIWEAKAAVDNLMGFHVGSRYLAVWSCLARFY